MIYPHTSDKLEPILESDTRDTVFVVDDDVSVRESVGSLLQLEGWRVETFPTAPAFLARPRALVPSCLILDISLPGLNGLDLQGRIAAERADMPIIFITGHGDIPMSVRAMKAGAVEFLTKPFSDEVLITAVRSALDQSRACLANEREIKTLSARYATLTPREREVMRLVVAGMLNKQVAFELNISEITVKAHRGKMMHKMEAQSLPDLVRMAARIGLTQATDN